MTPHESSSDQLRASIFESGLKDKTDAILALAKPCLRVQTLPTPDDEIPVGTSKFGGSPDLPSAFEWPSFQGAALTFLAQIDLSALPLRDGLPSEGLLSFFYETEEQPWGATEDRGTWAAVWMPSGALKRRSHPEVALPACRLELEERVSLPGGDSPLVYDLRLTETQDNAYFDLLKAIGSPQPEHQLLGYSGPIQNDVPLNVEIAASGSLTKGASHLERERQERASREWRLLLQLDSDKAIESTWGDSGMLYFMIREDDLRERRFDRTWMTLQRY